MSISIDQINYGPTPLHHLQGMTAFFSFTIVGTPGVPYSDMSGKVVIYDYTGSKTVRTLQMSVTPNSQGQGTVLLFWDGKDDNGVLVPPGDYAPTFMANATPQGGLDPGASATGCSGITAMAASRSGYLR